ncbi:hypothetical protein LX36DRAFT_493298 [Colletotrichum falcatum]|nr:hypothetical protein LX36DRAFT_493298 [Colletotrichum falcatum]
MKSPASLATPHIDGGAGVRGRGNTKTTRTERGAEGRGQMAKPGCLLSVPFPLVFRGMPWLTTHGCRGRRLPPPCELLSLSLSLALGLPVFGSFVGFVFMSASASACCVSCVVCVCVCVCFCFLVRRMRPLVSFSPSLALVTKSASPVSLESRQTKPRAHPAEMPALLLLLRHLCSHRCCHRRRRLVLAPFGAPGPVGFLRIFI